MTELYSENSHLLICRTLNSHWELWVCGHSGKVWKSRWSGRSWTNKEWPLLYKFSWTLIHVTSDVWASFTTVCLHNDNFRQFDLQIATALNLLFCFQVAFKPIFLSFQIIFRHSRRIRTYNTGLLLISQSCSCWSWTLEYFLEAQRRARAAAPKSLLLSRDVRRMWR